MLPGGGLNGLRSSLAAQREPQIQPGVILFQTDNTIALDRMGGT